MAEYAISGDVATLAGDDHTAGDPAALWVESSAPILVDSTTGRIGGRLRVTLEVDGTFEQTGLPETVSGATPLYRLVVDTLSLRRAGHKRGITTGWFPLEANRDLTWVIENYVETTLITSQIAADIAAAAALGATNDSATASYVADVDSATYAELTGTFSAKTPAIEQLRAILATSRRTPLPVIAFGSSTTAGVGATRTDLRWVDQFARKLQASYPSGIPNWEPAVSTPTAAAASAPRLNGVHVLNGGAAGTYANSYISGTALTQVATIQPRIIVHMIGANDYHLGVTPASYKTELGDALDDVDAQCTLPPIHVLCDTYARPDVTTPAYPWADYVEAMREIAAARPDTVAFVSVVSDFENADASGPSAADPLELIDPDTVHLTDTGHAFMAQAIAEALRLPPPPAVVRSDIYDRFQRAALGNTETGQTWTVQTGAFALTSTGLSVTTGGHVAAASGFSDAEVSAIITHDTSATDGIFVKSNDSSTRIAAFLSSTTQVQLYAASSLLTFAAVTLTAGDYHLALAVKGDAVTVHLNGRVVITYTLAGGTATTYSAYTSHGVRCSTANGPTRWRNFAVRRL